jgi:GDP-L-fucose synthase
LTGALEPSNEFYAIAKISGIKLCQAYKMDYGSNFITVMPPNVYGPNDHYDLENCHVLPALIRKIHEAKKLNSPTLYLWGSGKPKREFLHVDDLASAVVVASEKYDDPLHLNVGIGHDISIKELALLIADLTGFSGEIRWDESKPDGTMRKVLDVSRISSLGWQPTITLSEGISSTIAWFKVAAQKGEARL